MADDPLAQLDEKLRAARTRLEPAPRADEDYGRANQAWRMVIELVAGIGIGLAIGMGIDAVFGTRPVFMVIFMGFGFAAGIKVMLRTAEEVREKVERERAGEESADGDGS